MLDYELPIPGLRIRSETKGFNKLNNLKAKNENKIYISYPDYTLSNIWYCLIYLE